MTTSESKLLELLDREAIRDCQMRFCHGTDRRDRELLRSVYWPDAIADYGRFTGKAYEHIDITLARLNLTRQTNHFLGNMIIRIDGTSARVQANFIAYHCYRGDFAELAKDGPLVSNLLGGRYIDRMEKRSGEWRIQHRKVMFDWYRSPEPAAPELESGYRGLVDRIGCPAPNDEGSKLFGDALNKGLIF